MNLFLYSTTIFHLIKQIRTGYWVHGMYKYTYIGTVYTAESFIERSLENIAMLPLDAHSMTGSSHVPTRSSMHRYT